MPRVEPAKRRRETGRPRFPRGGQVTFIRAETIPGRGARLPEHVDGKRADHADTFGVAARAAAP